MTLEEAIGQLRCIYDDRKIEFGIPDSYPGQQALQLGIEALERIRIDRISPDVQVFKYLPSEIKAKKSEVT